MDKNNVKRKILLDLIKKINDLRWMAIPQWGDMDAAAVVEFIRKEAEDSTP